MLKLRNVEDIMLLRVSVTKTRFWIGNWIYYNLQVVTTINYYAITALHNVQWLHTNLFSLSALLVFKGL
jgi:hypothetical protein